MYPYKYGNVENFEQIESLIHSDSATSAEIRDLGLEFSRQNSIDYTKKFISIIEDRLSTMNQSSSLKDLLSLVKFFFAKK